MAGGAGFLAAPASPEVDVPTAKELIEEVHAHVSIDELHRMAAELERKQAALVELLGADITGERLRETLSWTFVARRRASAVLGTRSDHELQVWIGDLLAGDGAAATRLERFSGAAGELGSARAAELGSELMHFTNPTQHRLWTRWIWSPESRTGALALLIGEDYELDVQGVAAGYERVCEATDVLDASPEAAAFRGPKGGAFAVDLLLACTYGVYMRTVLGLKMTQEFNALVPPMAQLVRRLLGTHHHTQEASA
ncbi:MAG TPA: hypothetical protein VFP55_06120 [Solirubrobacteraceae bacterium]|nr:hypothetical protein [Solirubrobacteraceae bacterium]